MLVGTHDGAVEIDFLEVGVLTHYLENSLPYLLVGRTGKADINAIPCAEFWRQIPSRATRERHPQHCIDKQAVIYAPMPTIPSLTTHKRRYAFPLIIP